MKDSPYAIGNRWFCDAPRINGREAFYFVIIGPGARPGHKRCRIEVVPESRHREGSGHGTEQDYSHAHLKKYGVLQIEPKTEEGRNHQRLAMCLVAIKMAWAQRGKDQRNREYIREQIQEARRLRALGVK